MCCLLQHLVTLLSAPDAEVVAAALQALTAFLRKSHHQGPTRWPGSHVMRTRLAAMCRGWGGKEEVRPQRSVQLATPPKCDCMSDLVVHFLPQGLDLVSCVEEGDASIKQVSLRGCVVVPCTSNPWLSTLHKRMRCWQHQSLMSPSCIPTHGSLTATVSPLLTMACCVCRSAAPKQAGHAGVRLHTRSRHSWQQQRQRHHWWQPAATAAATAAARPTAGRCGLLRT